MTILQKPGRSVFYQDQPSNGHTEENSHNGTNTTDWQPLLDGLRTAKNGDFSVRLSVDEWGDIALAFNDLVSLNQNLSDELTKVDKVVGQEGRLTERVALRGATGSWLTTVDAVNSLIDNMAQPTGEVERVLTAVAKGDLSEKMSLSVNGRSLQGNFLQIATIVNVMVDQLNGFAGEVTRVAREVGTEGVLGGQAQVEGVSGTWKDLTDNVNLLASNLTSQVRNIADVTTAVAEGDLTKKITVEVKGEVLELKNTINVMVDQLNGFAGEVTRVAREVGTEGVLGGQAQVEGVSGTWKDLTDNVNLLASNLTSQVRNIADVTTAVAEGDLTKKITVEVKGEVLELKNTINVMVDQLNGFAGEVTRVAREVGTEGVLGGQAQVEGVSGTWKDLTDNVNLLASNLTSQVRNIADVTTAVAEGDLTKKITVEVKGEVLELKNTINVMVDQLNGFAGEVTRVAREVGTEGVLGGQAQVEGVSGTWKDLTDNVNLLASNLTSQVRNIADVTTAVAEGDLTKKITVEVKGEVLELKNTINVMVDQLNGFAGEVTRVAREVGTEGVLGGQAQVEGVSGTWKDLTDNVNLLASNLTSQVRNIADVTTAVAEGDLTKKITVEVKGEVLELKNTINVMVDDLNMFSSEVNRLAREVGIDGKLGSQAQVEGVSGAWKELTDNVNLMASNLTDQVKEIANVTTRLADSSESLTGVSHEMTSNAEQASTQANGVAASADQVSNNVALVATGTEEMSASIREIAKNANEAAQVGSIAVETAESTNATVAKLGESSAEIGNVIKVITSIAEQTNLLALNATIEAARAGEAGKGFAVVANEVKELANQTTKATEDIGKTIETIQGDTKGAVDAIKEISTIINQVNDFQNTIAAAVEEQTATTNEMARNVDEAARGASEIAQNIGEVAAAAQNTTSGAENTRQSADGMASLADELKDQIGRFTY